MEVSYRSSNYNQMNWNAAKQIKSIQNSRVFGQDVTNFIKLRTCNSINNHVTKNKKNLSAIPKVAKDTNSTKMSKKKLTFVPIKSPKKSRYVAKYSENELFVTEYLNDIWIANKANEKMMGDFMKNQNDINSRMRVILIDWLIEVQRKFKLNRPTLFLGINMLDRYLSKEQVHRSNLQLTGCACLWIASKYHEIYAPEMDDFVYISDNAFTTNDLLLKEVDILRVLRFELTVPTALNFVEHYFSISSFYVQANNEKKIIRDLILYCIEHCLMSYETCRELPSKIAGASFLYACIGTKVFTKEMFVTDGINKIIGYEIAELLPIMQKIDYFVKNAKQIKHKAVFKKYSHGTYSSVAKLTFNKLTFGNLLKDKLDEDNDSVMSE